MEPQVPGWKLRAGLLLLPLLLCFGPETTGSIDLDTLRVIVGYVNRYGGVDRQYAFATALPHDICSSSGTAKNIDQYVPRTQLSDMKGVLSQFGALYNPSRPPWNIVAARPKEVLTQRGKFTEHSEWRLLSGPQSPVAQLTARTFGQNSCLILFTFNSPCSTKCLRERGLYNIVNMTRTAFHPINNNFKAFVFQRIFDYDLTNNVTRGGLLKAWHMLQEVPLMRCENNVCHDCAAKEPRNNPCLAGKN
ncbi:uncharacterized protein LOC142025235 [Carettochelys insculpta]|uniref:uncharacterized protein LOC142025235 n=1 Tax=Carettochelys insculpta TaxID=44489 RepID=UPI003EB6D0BF